MTVEIRIEELVLRGIAPQDVAVVTDALRDHLVELATRGDVPPALDGASLVHRPRPVVARGPAELGAHAATAVWDAANGAAR